jgi:hypothetical protein
MVAVGKEVQTCVAIPMSALLAVLVVAGLAPENLLAIASAGEFTQRFHGQTAGAALVVEQIGL